MMPVPAALPETISTEEQLETLLSEPTAEDIETLSRIKGDILILGVGGKMGPSLAVRAKQALTASGSERKVIAVSRFSNGALVSSLAASGVDTVSADLLSPESYEALPAAEYVIHMVARKFGTSGEESMTWATNAFVPGLVGYRYRSSNIVTWSTGNVYPLFPIDSKGPTEMAALGPIGEYAQSALARERVFEYFARTYQTPLAILRLNYAVELRYGVLVDIANRILAGQPVNLSMGKVNVVWQGHANSVCLRCLELCSPDPFVLNITSAEAFDVAWIARRFADLFGVEARFEGSASGSALLSDAAKCEKLFGKSPVPIERMIGWIAQWLKSGGTVWNKPTHFEVKDGKF
jgi:nucleoside-diphosphate-sugar epimerase